MTIVLDRPVEVAIQTEELTQAQKDLLAAADLLEQKGWASGAYERGGRYCAVGALNMVILGQPMATSANSTGAQKERRKWLCCGRWRSLSLTVWSAGMMSVVVLLKRLSTCCGRQRYDRCYR